MSYSDVKATPEGDTYTGMSLGASHLWHYTGEWRETKLAPDQWGVRFEAVKRRRVAAPTGSGAPPGATWDWLVVARQVARKADANAYQTLLEGVKWKIGQAFPGEAVFSYERRGMRDVDVVRAYLDKTMDLLRARKVPGVSSRPVFSEV